MKNHKKSIFLLGILLALALTSVSCSVLAAGSSGTASEKQTLFEGVTYIREVRTSPRTMVVHIVKIKVSKSTIKPLVTPADRPKSDQPYDARTTSEFLKEFKVQLAINGSGFQPWYDYSLQYYPHSGDPVTPLGTTISNNFSFIDESDESRPTLMFSGKRPVDIGWVDGKAKYALSGIRILAEKGEVATGLDNSAVEPRTAVGDNQSGSTLIIVIVDGRQPGYSLGATLQELAQILVDNGAYTALELDGGGSSTLVIEGEDGQPVVLNSPVHQRIPGNERPVATHIGFFIKD